jgi:hypothetical protein
MNAKHAGLSHESSITLLRFFPDSFTFDDIPHTMNLPNGAKPVAIQADRDFIALDDQGGVWVLLQRDPPINQPATGEFQRLELPGPAAAIEADVGYCARLTNGGA